MKNWDNTLRQLEQLDDIPGIDKTATAAILAEIGTDMSRFKTAEHICSWAGLSPGNNESAGKKSPPAPPTVTPI
jgi:transposase